MTSNNPIVANAIASRVYANAKYDPQVAAKCFKDATDKFGKMQSLTSDAIGKLEELNGIAQELQSLAETAGKEEGYAERPNATKVTAAHDWVVKARNISKIATDAKNKLGAR